MRGLQGSLGLLAGMGCEGAAFALQLAQERIWARYSTALGTPRSARSDRKAMTNALPGQFAIVEEKFALLDDLIIQFHGTELGDRFMDAWFNARRVIDTGRRANKPTPAPVPVLPANPSGPNLSPTSSFTWCSARWLDAHSSAMTNTANCMGTSPASAIISKPMVLGVFMANGPQCDSRPERPGSRFLQNA